MFKRLVESKGGVPGENFMSEMLSFLSLNPTIFSSDTESKMRKPPSLCPTATVEPSGEYVTARPPFLSFLTYKRDTKRPAACDIHVYGLTLEVLIITQDYNVHI